jgi:hypothetical protein
MDKLPYELLEDILRRQNVEEITGLCNSNKNLRKQCGYYAKSKLTRKYDDLGLFLAIKQFEKQKTTFRICITTYQGDSDHKVVQGIDSVAPSVAQMLEEGAFAAGNPIRDLTITETMDNRSHPTMINIVAFYMEDDIDENCTQMLNIVLQGDFKNYRTASSITDQISETIESYTE